MPTEASLQDPANLLSGIDRERPDFANSLSSAAERIRELAQLVAARLDRKRSEQRDLGASKVAHDDELLGHSREVDRLEINLARLTREVAGKKLEVDAFFKDFTRARDKLLQQDDRVDEVNADIAMYLPPGSEKFTAPPSDDDLEALQQSLEDEADQQGIASEWKAKLSKARDELGGLKKELLNISKVLLENRGRRDAAKLLVDEEGSKLEDLNKTISHLESIGRDLEEAVVFTGLLQENMRLLGTLEGEISVGGKTTSQVRDDLRRRLDAVIAHVTGKLVEGTLAVRGVEQELMAQSDRLNLCVSEMRGAFEDDNIGTEAHRIGLHASVENLVRLVRGFDARHAELAAQTLGVKDETHAMLEEFNPDRVIAEAAAPTVVLTVGPSSEAIAAELEDLRAELERRNHDLIEVGVREAEVRAQLAVQDAALRREVASLEAELKLRTKGASATGDLAAVRTQATEAEAKAAALQAELDGKEDKLQQISGALGTVTAEKTQLAEELAAAQETAERERTAKLQLAEDLGRARADLRGKEDEAAGLKTELEKLRAKASATAAPPPAAVPPLELRPATPPVPVAVPPRPAPPVPAPAAPPRLTTPPVPVATPPQAPPSSTQPAEATAVTRPPTAPAKIVGAPRPPGRPGRR